ncbi:hypothetical protein BGZ98_005418 [Dissophora globulifera]|nr:hypothetical protein BGZ98_005418 [Dissophora globulifera]
MPTTTSAFDPSLLSDHSAAVAANDALLSSELRVKSRLQKIIRIPPSVAQTHTRMSTIRLGISRVDKKKLATATATATATLSFKPTSPLTPHSTATAEQSPAEAAPELGLRHQLSTSNSNTNTNSSSTRTKHDDYDGDDEDQDDHDRDYDDTDMAPREGFSVSYSLFAKVKARVLQNNNKGNNNRLLPQQPPYQQYQQQQQQQQQQKLQQLHPVTNVHTTDESGSSQEETVASRGSGSDVTEVESNSSNSNPCTLSAGTAGIISSSNSNSNLILCHDPTTDSESTVTDIDDSATRLRQRKYSFGSRHNIIGPAENAGPSSSSGAGETAVSSSGAGYGSVSSHADLAATEMLAEEDEIEVMGEDDDIVIVGDPADMGQDPSTSQLKSSSIRGKCWKLLLEVHHVSAQEYVSLVKQGKPQEYGKIRNDTFRTMATDRNYTTVVEEDSLIRVLCAFAWSTQATSAQDSGVSFTYVQGMNVLAAPFLYTMSEMEAFYAYSNLLKYCCPLYVQPTLQGVHCGIKLLEECLCKIDPELYDYLKSKKLSAELYAFPSVLTLCACTPPLDQAMQLWDFLLAWGIHLNIICIIAQLHLIRNELMGHFSPMKLLRIFPDLEADKIIRETIRMVKLLPDELYDLLVRHPYDSTVAEQIGY